MIRLPEFIYCSPGMNSAPREKSLPPHDRDPLEPDKFHMIPGFSASGLGLKLPEPAFGLHVIAAAGFRAVDLRIRDLVESRMPALELKRRLDDLGLIPGTCQFPLDWRHETVDFAELLWLLPTFLEFAASIGVVNFYTRVTESVPDNSSADSILIDHRRKLVAIAKAIEEFGIGLALETVGVESFRNGRMPLMASLGQVRNRLSECFDECPNLGLLVDAFHLHAAGESVEKALGPFASRVFGVHVADLPGPVKNLSEIVDDERALPGITGQVCVKRILQLLRDAGCPLNTPVIVETIRCPAHLLGANFETIVQAVFAALADSFD